MDGDNIHVLHVYQCHYWLIIINLSVTELQFSATLFFFCTCAPPFFGSPCLLLCWPLTTIASVLSLHVTCMKVWPWCLPQFSVFVINTTNNSCVSVLLTFHNYVTTEASCVCPVIFVIKFMSFHFLASACYYLAYQQ